MGIKITHKLIKNLTPEEYFTYMRCNMRENGSMMPTIMDHRHYKTYGYAIRAIDTETDYLVGAGIVSQKIFMVYVRMKYRRQGLGSRIALQAGRISNEKDWKPALYTWDDRSVAFYDKNLPTIREYVA